MSELDKCIEKGLIRRTIPSQEKATKSLNKSRKWLEEAKKNHKFKLFDSCVVSSYSAMFHATRSLLFKDGYREKSHYCMARYLEEKYVDTGKMERIIIDLLDRFRELRHEELYELDFCVTEEDADEAVQNAEKVLTTVEKLIQ